MFDKGKDKGTIETKITTIENNIVEIKKRQSISHNDVLKNRLINKAEITKLYKELLVIQDFDKKVTDYKFNLIMDYGIKNLKDKNNLKNIFEMIDNDRNADISRLHSNTNYKDDTIVK